MKKLLPLVLALVPGVVAAQERLAFIQVEPCRLLDTRGTIEGPLESGVIRPVTADGHCEIPMEARAIEANLTVTNTQGPGFLSTIRPAARIPKAPASAKTSSVNYSSAGLTVANAATVGLGASGDHSWDGVFWLLASISGTDVVVDVSGYYVALP
jgi:hypothetical protein